MASEQVYTVPTDPDPDPEQGDRVIVWYHGSEGFHVGARYHSVRAERAAVPAGVPWASTRSFRSDAVQLYHPDPTQRAWQLCLPADADPTKHNPLTSDYLSSTLTQKLLTQSSPKSWDLVSSGDIYFAPAFDGNYYPAVISKEPSSSKRSKEPSSDKKIEMEWLGGRYSRKHARSTIPGSFSSSIMPNRLIPFVAGGAMMLDRDKNPYYPASSQYRPSVPEEDLIKKVE